MAEPVKWHGVNKTLQAPKELGCIETIHVFNNNKYSISCWKLSPEELADVVQNDGHVFIMVLGGPSQYPMFVGSEQTVRDVAVDFGKVWDKNKNLDIRMPGNKNG